MANNGGGSTLATASMGSSLPERSPIGGANKKESKKNVNNLRVLQNNSNASTKENSVPPPAPGISSGSKALAKQIVNGD